jgi:CheY-like chemotaxis protein
MPGDLAGSGNWNRSDIMQQATLELEPPDVQQLTRGMAEFRSCDAAAKMLVVDDDAWVVRTLAYHCTRIGFDVDTAANGLEALFKASRRKPDILVIDIKMPEVDGLSVCAHLLDADKVPPSVIVITGGRDPNVIERCKDLGAYYVRKGPHFWNDLEDALVEIDPLTAARIGENWARGPAPAVRSRPRVLLIDDDNDVGVE